MYYNSIKTLPVEIFNEIFETKNYMLLVQNGEHNINELQEVWGKIVNEFFEHFEFPNDLIYFYNYKKDIELLEIENIINDNAYNTILEIEKSKYKPLENGKKVNFMETVVMVEKQMGFQINTMQTSTLKFYSYIHFLKKYNKPTQ